jgi:tellurite resistance protein TerC
VLLATTDIRDKFVDIDVPGWAWIALVLVLLAMLAVDLVRHREDHAPTNREALIESLGWVACGLSFGAVVAVAWGGDAFGEYISGYLIEKSLSVDNVFVWAVLFSTFKIPLKYQHRVLFYGIFGALVLRVVFIFVGSALLDRFDFLLIVFGAFLLVTGIRVIRHTDDEGETTSTRGVGLLGRIMPVSDEFDGHNFVTVKDGVKMATPLLAALVVIEFTDVVFALDSVPAILAVSHEPFLVFASNAFAILGLRAMYFLLANAKDRFHYLGHGLGSILIFVGIKMAVVRWYHLDTYVSLGIILAMLVLAVLFSEIRTRRELGAGATAD